jgi:hypothetical protein
MTDTASHIAPVAAAAPKRGYARVLRAVISFARNQGTQASTYRGIVMLLTACGVYLKPEMVAAITAAGMGLSGAIAVLFPDTSTDAP